MRVSGYRPADRVGRYDRRREAGTGRRFPGPDRSQLRSAGVWLLTLVGRESGTAALLGFLLARVVLLGQVSPFALGFLAAVRALRPRLAAGAMLGAVLGVFTVRQGLWAAEGTAALLLTWGLLALTGWRSPRPTWWNLAMAGTVLVAGLATGAGVLVATGVTAYGLARTVLEAALASFFSLVALDAVPTLLPRRQAGTAEGRKLSALLLLALAVEGLGNWGVAFVRAQRVAGAAVVMLAGSLAGGPGGAATGVLVGTVAMLCSARPEATAVAVSGVAGLLGGSFRPAGRPGVVLGYLLGVLVLSPLTPDLSGMLMVMAEAAVGAVAFLLIPRRVMERASVFLGQPAAVAVREPPAKGPPGPAEVTQVLTELSLAASEVLGGPAARPPDSAGEVFAAIAARLCETCPSRAACWNKDFCRTYEAFYELVAGAEGGGELAPGDLPPAIRRRCSRQEELARTAGLVLELKRQEDYWRRRLAESGDLLRALLEGMAEVAAAERDLTAADRSLGPEVEERLAETLERAGFPAVQVQTAYRSSAVRVVAGRCPGFDRCRTEAAPAARAVLGRPVVARRECEWAADGLRCRFVLSPAPGLGFRIGVARLPKEAGEVPGDSFVARQLDPGRLLLALSNGMGAGARAAGESKAALSLLERILRAGFATAAAIRVLNSLMLCRTPDESFATLDLAIVDLHTGDADLVKVGACPSLLRRPHGEVLTIGGTAPPLGILRRVDPERARRTLREGDILAMVTDGLLDPGRRGRRPDWVAHLLERPPVLEPQALAQHILDTSRALGGTGDDMTVMVAAFHGRPEGEGKGGSSAER